MLDHDKLVALHAAQAPWWEPGIAVRLPRDQPGLPPRRDRQARVGPFARHVLRRRGRRSARRRLPHRYRSRARLAHRPRDPTAGADHRRAAGGLDSDSIAVRTMLNPPLVAEFSSTKEWRRAEIPAAGGHGNARSVALCHTPTACGGSARGVTLLSEEGVARIFDEQQRGVDLVLGVDMVLGMGFGLPGPMLPGTEPAHGVLGRVGRLAGDHRRRAEDELQLRDEQDGRGHDRRHPRRRTPHGRLRRADVPA